MAEFTELLRIIERLEELHNEVQGIIKPPKLSTTLLYYVSRWWSLYLNRCVSTSLSEVHEAPRAMEPLTLDPILLDMEGGRYVRPILLGLFVDLVAGIHGGVSRGGYRRGSGREEAAERAVLQGGLETSPAHPGEGRGARVWV